MPNTERGRGHSYLDLEPKIRDLNRANEIATRLVMEVMGEYVDPPRSAELAAFAIEQVKPMTAELEDEFDRLREAVKDI
jgi:hypothetical protein